MVSLEVHPPMTTTTTMTTPRRERQRARNWQRAVNLVCSPLDNRTSPLHHVSPSPTSCRRIFETGSSRGGTREGVGGGTLPRRGKMDGKRTRVIHGTRYTCVCSVYFEALPVVLGVDGGSHPWQRVKGPVSSRSLSPFTGLSVEIFFFSRINFLMMI